ncbi:MAG: hypothetical protein ACYTBS_03005 [Planctomycetota bacterium]
MEWLNGYKMRLAVVGCVGAVMLGGGNVNADFTFGAPTLVDGPFNGGGIECFNCISADSLEAYIDRPIPADDVQSLDWDLHVSTRATTNDPWSVPVGLGPAVNSSYVEGCASLSGDGRELYFSSNRGGHGRQEIWVTTRCSKGANWGTAVKLRAPINTGSANMTPWITADGLELYFSSNRPGGSGNVDIWVSRRASARALWGEPVNLGPRVNSVVDDCFPCLSTDGLVLFFCDGDNPSSLFRPGGHGRTDMWVSRRRSTAHPWGSPVNLGPNMNTSLLESQPRISPDGSVLYFTCCRPTVTGSVSDIRQAPIIPVADFNADGIVDSADMYIMIDLWGTNDPLCDIGPMPWGDGMVDVQDLAVLTEHLSEESPLAEPGE